MRTLVMNKELIIGTLLGDAYIPKLYGRSKSYSIGWQHSLKQEEYALWKADKAKVPYSIYKRERLDKRTNKVYKSITIYSTGTNFKYYRKLFYPKGIKVISKNILSKLTPLSIAIWFCDDGNLYYNGNNCHLTLGVDCFNSDVIIKYFKERWNLNFKKCQARIRLTSVKEVNKFEYLFRDFYPYMMGYKTLAHQKNIHINNLKK